MGTRKLKRNMPTSVKSTESPRNSDAGLHLSTAEIVMVRYWASGGCHDKQRPVAVVLPRQEH